jgi:hypothetical protein
MHLEHETQRAVNNAVRDVFRKAAAFDEMYAVIQHWLYEQGIRMGMDGRSGQWHLMYRSGDKAGLPIGKFITFAQAFERAIEEIERGQS